jgi:hypothetical protein
VIQSVNLPPPLHVVVFSHLIPAITSPPSPPQGQQQLKSLHTCIRLLVFDFFWNCHRKGEGRVHSTVYCMSGYCSDTTKACQRVCLASFFWHIEKCQHFKRFQILLRIIFWKGRFFLFLFVTVEPLRISEHPPPQPQKYSNDLFFTSGQVFMIFCQWTNIQQKNKVFCLTHPLLVFLLSVW